MSAPQPTAEPSIVPQRERPLARIEPVCERAPMCHFGEQRERMPIKGDNVYADFGNWPS